MSSFAPRRTTHSQRDMIHGALCMRSTSQQFASAILLETSVCVRNCARPALTEVGVSLRVVLKPAMKDGAHLSNWYSVSCSWNWEGGVTWKNRLMCFFVTSPLSICCNRLLSQFWTATVQYGSSSIHQSSSVFPLSIAWKSRGPVRSTGQRLVFNIQERLKCKR